MQGGVSLKRNGGCPVMCAKRAACRWRVVDRVSAVQPEQVCCRGIGHSQGTLVGRGPSNAFPWFGLAGVSLAPKKCRWAARGMTACQLARLADARCVRRLGVPAFCERDIA